MDQIERIINDAIYDFSNKWQSHSDRDEGVKEYAEKIKVVLIQNCKDALLKQTFTMIHSNGYPCEAVPKSTILSLSTLVKTV